MVAVVGVSPTGTGVGVPAGKDGGGIRVNFLELLLLVCRYPGLLAEQILDGQAVQGHETADLGVADVQIFQAGTACQGAEIRQLQAVGKLQIFQLLAIFKAGEVAGGTAGENQNFQFRHIADEAQIRQGIVVTHVDVFDTADIPKLAASGVGDVVNGADGGGVCQSGVAAVGAVVYPPHQIHIVIILTDGV